MDCRSKSSVDFCEDPACATATVGLDERDDLEKPHIPTHEVFKVYTVLHGRCYAMTETKAKDALTRARTLFNREIVASSDVKHSKPNSGHSDARPVQNGNDITKNVAGPPAEKPPLACSNCKEKVSLSPPCWACVECGTLVTHISCTMCRLLWPVSAGLFICDACDAKWLAFNETHNHTHAIVRCQPAAKEITTEERLIKMEAKMEARLARVENVLQTVLRKLESEEIVTVEDIKSAL